MEDEKIISLYMERNEDAIRESNTKYGPYCHTVSYNILRNHEDSEECVNDTWNRAWNAIPPEIPKILRAYFARITRNLSLNRIEKDNAKKRGGSETVLAFDELEECIPANRSVEEEIDEKILKEMIDGFLKKLPEKQRVVFMKRYFYVMSVAEIASELSLSESNVKAILFRVRNRLKDYLAKEGVNV